jgi:Spy/CpxP family protein refolding chaperone
MQSLKATVLLGALLSSGFALAQTTPNANPGTQLSAQNPPAAQAQGVEGTHGHHGMNPNKQAKHLAKELNLSQDQVAQIKPILLERKQQMESLRADQSLAPKDRRAKMHDIQLDSKSKIEAVLNDTQKQQFEQMQAARRAHRKGTAPQPKA